MFYLIYKTTNLINGRYYIGKHKTNDKNDSYLGSGIALEQAIKKYGRESFKREILFECNSEEEMNQKEKEIITSDIINDNLSYNIGLGGEGGAMFLGHHHSNETKEKLRILSLNRIITDETKKKISESNKGRIVTKETREKISLKAKERFLSEENRLQISNSLKEHYNIKGRKHKIREKSRYNKNDIDNTKKRCYVHNNDKEYRIFISELDYYLNNGWKKGRNPQIKSKLSSSLKGTGCGKNNSVYGMKWMYNDELKQSKMIKQEEFDYYLNNGWKFGCKNKIYK